MTTWRVTELYGAQWRRRRRNAVFLVLLGKTTGSSKTQIAPTPPMSAPGGLARRFWGDVREYHTRDIVMDASTRPASGRVCEKSAALGTAKKEMFSLVHGNSGLFLSTIFADAVRRRAPFL